MKVPVLLVLAVFGFSQMSVADEAQKPSQSEQATEVAVDNGENSQHIPAVTSEEVAVEKQKHNPHKMLNTKFLSRRPYMEIIK